MLQAATGVYQQTCAGCNSKHLERVTENSNAIFSQMVTRIGLKFYRGVSMVPMFLRVEKKKYLDHGFGENRKMAEDDYFVSLENHALLWAEIY